MPTFAQRIHALLPELYLREDTTGDLHTLLQIIGVTLDELQVAIAGMPTLASVADCSPEFLPYLAALVGVTYDPTADPAPQRRAIREAIERYRRIGTLAALRRELLALAWIGQIIETHEFVLRLNTRAILNHQKLPGPRYNLGIYGVTGIDPDDDALRAVLDRHHPAGTRRWTDPEEVLPS